MHLINFILFIQKSIKLKHIYLLFTWLFMAIYYLQNKNRKSSFGKLQRHEILIFDLCYYQIDNKQGDVMLFYQPLAAWSSGGWNDILLFWGHLAFFNFESLLPALAASVALAASATLAALAASA